MSQAIERPTVEYTTCCCSLAVEEQQVEKTGGMGCCATDTPEQISESESASATTAVNVQSASRDVAVNDILVNDVAVKYVAVKHVVAKRVVVKPLGAGNLAQALSQEQRTNVSDDSTPATCMHSGVCPNQIQADSQSSAPPPPRSLEQERVENLTIFFQTLNVLPIIESFLMPANGVTSVFSSEPSNLSGIGSQLLLC